MATYTTEQYRVYQKKRYHERVGLAKRTLGGQCCKCGSKKDLQIDHVDPQKKKYNISYITRLRMETFLEEIKKCQLLCQKCHGLKTLKDKGQKPVKGTHGTLSSYQYCKCDKCKEAHSKHHQRYYAENKDWINKNKRDRRKRARSSVV